MTIAANENPAERSSEYLQVQEAVVQRAGAPVLAKRPRLHAPRGAEGTSRPGLARGGLVALLAFLALPSGGCEGPELASGTSELRGFADPDCPPDPGVVCEEVPAAYVLRDRTTGSYGNYDLANRPRDGQDIRFIVIHTTEVSYEGTVRIFTDPSRSASAHYLVRSRDGLVTKFISPKHVAWHAGNWFYNMHSVGIEHEAFSAEGHAWFTDALYASSAALVRHLARRYHVPLDREHIFGHDEVPGLTQARQPQMHWDPGPYWDWDRFMRMVRAEGGETPIHDWDRPDRGPDAAVIALHPDYANNQPPLSHCFDVPPGSPPDCRAVPPQPSNFVYLRESPSDTAALISNPYFPSTPGDRMFNWGNKLGTGRYFYRAERKGDWDAIYFSGVKAWFKNPGRAATGVPTRAEIVITPKTAGMPAPTSIPVYGGGYPADAAYPPPTVPQKLEKIYDMPAGQRYVAKGPVTADYYWAKVYADTLATASHRLVYDDTLYYEVSWNHRLALVRASDVEVVRSSAPLTFESAPAATPPSRALGVSEELPPSLELRDLR